MKTITTTIKWHNAAEELPEKSCAVVVWILSSGYCATLNYSARHRLFNVHDFFTETDARQVAIEVQYWCYLDEVRMALTKIEFREEAWNAFEKALKECLAELASKGESVIKPKMTPEEVMQAFHDSARLTKIDVNGKTGETAYFMDDEVHAAVTDALCKQIPQNPVLLSDDGDEGEENLYGCPRCSNPYIDSLCCSVCGQALDWEGIEE